MARYLFILFLSLWLFNTADAQKKDTAVYYLQNSGKIVSTKDSADFFVAILPPDPNVDNKLFIVKEFYRNGKTALIGNSSTNTLNNLKFEGTSISFFPNGHKMQIANYLSGQLSGDVMNYYPNGKLYNVKSYSPNKKPFLKQCNDSTGAVLAQNGNGKWIKFDGEILQTPYVEGNVVGGIEDGEWRGKENDTTSTVKVYKNGVLASVKTFDKSGNEVEDKIFTVVGISPEFPGGFEAFNNFLRKNVDYPALAYENGVKGQVIIGFVIEKNGELSYIRIIKGIGSGCDEEAVPGY